MKNSPRLWHSRKTHFLILLACLMFSATYSLSNAQWHVALQNFYFDTLNQKHQRTPSDQILIVDIDEASLERLGQWPWSRTTVAKLVDALTAMGAKTIAFDGVLAEPDATSPDLIARNLPQSPDFDEARTALQNLGSHDDILARSIARSGIFVSGFTYAPDLKNNRSPQIKKEILARSPDKASFIAHSTQFSNASTFLPALEGAAAGNGSFMAIPSHDGVIRKAGLLFSDGSNLYPSLALEALRVGYDSPNETYKIGRTPLDKKNIFDTDYRLIIGEHAIPLNPDGKLFVHHRIFNENGDDYLSAYKVLDEDTKDDAAQRIAGKYILIGASAQGLKDLRSTPLEAFQSGVEIHASVLEQILQNNFLIRTHPIEVAEFIAICLIGALIVILALYVSPLPLFAICASIIVLAFFGAQWAYLTHGLLFDPLYGSLSVALLFVVAIALDYMRSEQEKTQVRQAFGQYVSSDYINALVKDPAQLKLGGQDKEITVLFSDIRNFTTLSEQLPSQELIQLINDFLTPMSDIVMEHQGTIDKYMGDAMMAFWGAPLDDPKHADHACQAALKIKDMLASINHPLQAGIGINTGICAVGNMGSRQRFAYSALGDAVNVSSRLEGQTKTYGVDIIVGEDTVTKTSHNFAWLELDRLQVKGCKNAACIFALLGDKSLSQSNAFKALKDQHDQMITYYKNARFQDAEKLIADCKAQQSHLGLGLEAFYDLYAQRISDLIAHPPDNQQWDGVFVAQSK